VKIEEIFDSAVQNHKKSNFKTAENFYNRILKINPNHFETIFLLGTLFIQTKNYDRAVKFLMQGTIIQPNHEKSYSNLGIAYKELGEFQKAVNSLNKAIEIKPNYADAHNNLGTILKELGKKKEALKSYEKAIQISPNHVDSHNNLGVIFKEFGEFKKAKSCYEKAIKIRPDYIDAYYNLGNLLEELDKHQEAIINYEKAIKINPNFASAHYNLGNVLRILGEFQKAINSYQKAINSNYNYNKAYNNILFTLLYLEKVDPKYYLSKAKEFRLSLKSIDDHLLTRYQYDIKPKKLKIGFVSGNFRQHPVGFFLLDTLNKLKNKDLDLIAYSNSEIKDSFSLKLKSHFNKWQEISNQNNYEVINQIRKDGIHILIDLSGHSEHNRLPIFINRPAPIQVSWIGYPHSTGIPEIDYLIGDSFVTPLNENKQFTEKIFRLPNMWVCFSVPEFQIDITELPAIKNKYITFGSFNNLSKINNKVIFLWSKILKSIPKSKIFLKTKQLKNLYLKDKIISEFKKNDIDLNSIILEEASSRRQLLNSYNNIDIALDPFPYSGGVTSLEAIWMGVPVLTKKGSRFVSHTTESINYNSGMKDWVAVDENEYLKKAIQFSNDLDHLKSIKKNLRQKALGSPLFNSSLFANQLSDAFWKMWKNFIV